jgi:hypothetical protein
VRERWHTVPVDRRIELAVTIAICLATTVYTVFSIGSWRETKKAADAAQSAAKTAADSLADSRLTSDQILKLMRDQAEATRASAQAASDSAEASKTQANASARLAREAGRANQLSAESMRNAISATAREQRSLIEASGFGLKSEPIPNEPIGEEKAYVTYHMKNIGRTHALNVRVREWGVLFPPSVIEPAEPDWTTMPASAPVAIAPSISQPFVANQPDYSRDIEFVFRGEGISSYRNKTMKMYIALFITYEDAFGPHWTKACVSRLFSSELNKWDLCRTAGTNDAR